MIVNDKTIEIIKENPSVARKALLTDFALFIKVFHYYLKGNQFEIMPFHHKLINKLLEFVFGTNKKQNLYVGISPRAGKSQLIIYFIAYCYAFNYKCNFLYTSYSDSLCKKHSKLIRDVITCDLFQMLFGLRIDQSTSASDLWKINKGGEFRAVPLGGAVTGFGCFSYNCKVKTDKGYISIGKIVKEKLPVKVYSWGKKGTELSKILNYVEIDEKPEFDICFGKEKIKATRDHLFMTNKGWKKAEELRTGDWVFSPNSFYNICRAIKFFFQRFYRVFFISNFYNFLSSKNLFIIRDIVSSSLKSDTDCFPRPLTATFNIRHLATRNKIISGNKFIGSRVLCYLSRNLFVDFCVSVMRSMRNGILFIIRLCSINKIRKIVVKRITVKMSNNKSIGFTKKCKGNKFMNGLMIASAKRNKQISFFARPRFKDFICLFGKNLSILRNAIIRILGYRVITDISINKHCSSRSYCLSTDNHNFFIGESNILVHNCGTFEDRFGGAIIVDDFMKADDARSQAVKQSIIETFENTLKSRKNRPAKDPTIIIAQRLSHDDLVSYIEEKYPDEWELFVLPALNEETGESFWEERFPASMLLTMKEQNPFLFYSQYQQAPVPAGGGVIKHNWWRYYADMEDTSYQRIFMTADTASKTKEWNDYTAIGVWGLTRENKLRLLDMIHAKMEMPELEASILTLYNKWKTGIRGTICSAIYIEDKASGIALIQQLMRKGGLPIQQITPKADKLTRVLEVVPQIAAGNVELPESENHPLSREFLAESDLFAADLSHKHDDMVDMMVYAVDKAYVARGYF